MFRNLSVDNDEMINAIKAYSENLMVAYATTNLTPWIPLTKIFETAKQQNQAVIITITPGPFKTAQELPSSSTTNPDLLGCNLQLSAFEKVFPALNAIVIALNKHGSSYQSGNQGLLAQLQLNSLRMISDVDDSLSNAWHLPEFSVAGKRYLKRMTIVFKPDGTAKIFFLPSNVTQIIADDHVKDIDNFIHPVAAPTVIVNASHR